MQSYTKTNLLVVRSENHGYSQPVEVQYYYASSYNLGQIFINYYYALISSGVRPLQFSPRRRIPPI